MKLNEYKNKIKNRKIPGNQTPCHSSFFGGDHLRSTLGIICGPIWESFTVRDHLRRCTHQCRRIWSVMTCFCCMLKTDEIICGPHWGSLAVRDHLRSNLGDHFRFGDHLRRCTVCPSLSSSWKSLALTFSQSTCGKSGPSFREMRYNCSEKDYNNKRQG